MSVESILESIEKLTLLEAAELVKAMEEKFGVSQQLTMLMLKYQLYWLQFQLIRKSLY